MWTSPIDREKMNRAALESMLLDVEAAKTFLLQRNNEGKLNIEQLGVLGTGLARRSRINWAVRDWNVRNLPTYKMGQDVKALILDLAAQSFKGVTVNVALKDRIVLGQLSVLTVVGQQDARRYADAKRIYKAFEQSHREGDEVALPFYEADSALQGIDLMYDRDLRVPEWISGFIDERLVKRGTDLPGRIGRVRSSSVRQRPRRNPSVGNGTRRGASSTMAESAGPLAAAAAVGRNDDRHTDRQQLRIRQDVAVRFQDVRGPLRVAQISDCQ